MQSISVDSVDALRNLLSLVVNNTKQQKKTAQETNRVKTVLKQMLGRNPTKEEIAQAENY